MIILVSLVKQLWGIEMVKGFWFRVKDPLLWEINKWKRKTTARQASLEENWYILRELVYIPNTYIILWRVGFLGQETKNNIILPSDFISIDC